MTPEQAADLAARTLLAIDSSEADLTPARRDSDSDSDSVVSDLKLWQYGWDLVQERHQARLRIGHDLCRGAETNLRRTAALYDVQP